MAQEVKLAVRELVEFILRGGSIDNRFGGNDRALEGARIHRRLQKNAGEHYKAEVYLSIALEHEAIPYLIDGRADGIFTEDGRLCIDEIKTTAAPEELIHEDFNRVHWAQAMCYAYIVAHEQGLDEIAVRLTYFQIDTEQIIRFTRGFDFPALESFFYDLLSKYQIWARLQEDWTEIRNASIQALPFPFQQYRAGQRRLAGAVYRTIEGGGLLFCQAPTGIGKTISTLFPTVKAMGAGMVERIFYLTAKTITRQAAEEAFARMREGGLRIKTVTLTAKDKVCFLEERDCNPDACPYADGYYDRANDAVYALLQEHDQMTRETIEAHAKKHRLCPFELALDLTLWCDAIVCDYNYLFDPVVALKRFFSDAPKRDYAFLIDEAHNLVDRAREMYSAQLDKTDFLSFKKLLGKQHRALSRLVNEVNSDFIDLRRQCPEREPFLLEKPPEALGDHLTRLLGGFEEWLQENQDSPIRPQALDLYFKVRFYQKITDFCDKRYRVLATAHANEVTLRLLCLDPSVLLRTAMEHGRAAVLFSATLTPLDYFSAILGGDENAKRLTLPSPFEQKRLCLLLEDRISTRYLDREASIEPIVRAVQTLVSARTGNYLVYFPSYQYMNDVYAAFQERFPEIRTILQTGGMDEAAREAFLAHFDHAGAETLVGFCVLGGIYSEGIDLKGDRLIGTVVVGVGLPQIGPEQDLLRDYFNQQNGMGFEYAYQYPGMNKVLQAGGRVIRGEEDRGVVLLIDSRFSNNAYRPLFPLHWNHCQIVRGVEALRQALDSFWQ